MKNVVLIHGLYMPTLTMKVLANRLESKGYSVHVFGYNTLDFGSAAAKLNAFVGARFSAQDDVHFVGHSMGGLVIRDYFDKFKPVFNDSSVVTIGSPHSGAMCARFLKKFKTSFILGRSVEALSTGLEQKPVHPDFGVIVGTCNAGLGYIIGMKGGDGLVSLDDAKFEYAKETTFINREHIALIYSKTVVEQVHSFIESRAFVRVTETQHPMMERCIRS